MGVTELAFLAYINQPITARDCAVQKDGFVVPDSKALHDETVNSIAHYAPHNLEDIFDSKRFGDSCVSSSSYFSLILS